MHLPLLHDIDDTRDALHAYAKVLRDWLETCRPRRKHWWHASLRPSIRGVTTGVIHAGQGFEFELNWLQSRVHAYAASGDEASKSLNGQPATDIADFLTDFALAHGLSAAAVPALAGTNGSLRFNAYSVDKAVELTHAMHAVGAAMQRLRAGIREETSPIQLWPHHFDLSMVWLPGEKIASEDPDDEEASDKQLAFGFVYGDAAIRRPYVYITPYPCPAAMANTPLPEGTHWQSDAFEGAVLAWDTLLEQRDPTACLDQLFELMLEAGRRHL